MFKVYGFTVSAFRVSGLGVEGSRFWIFFTMQWPFLRMTAGVVPATDGHAPCLRLLQTSKKSCQKVSTVLRVLV